MQTFIAKWNGTERVFEMPLETTSFVDLQLRVQSEFQLPCCKITGLKPNKNHKKFKQANDNNHLLKLVDCFILQQPKQKILVIGSQTELTNEAEQMMQQDEILEEEVNYDAILAGQYTLVLRKLRQANALQYQFIQQMLTPSELRNIVKTLCHQGDVATLRRVWEPELAENAKKFANFAIQNDKFNILMFFRNKNIFKFRLSAKPQSMAIYKLLQTWSTKHQM